MLLAQVLSEYPDELRADFQEIYSLNIDDMGVAYSLSHASVLCAQLPPRSRVFVAINPANAWDKESQLLAWIEYNQRVYMAALGDNAKKRIAEQVPMLPDALIPKEMRKKQQVSMSIEDFDKFIKRNRKEVTNG